MSRYWELRPLYHRPHQERAALVRREMLAVLAAARDDLQELMSADAERRALVFGQRSAELFEIAGDSADNLTRLVEAIPPDGAGVDGDEPMRDLRHDLRGPVGTLRGAAMVLVRAPAEPDHPLAERARAVVRAAEELRDIIEALTEDAQRE